MDPPAVDDIIERLLTDVDQLTEDDIRDLCAAATVIFLNEPSLLKLEAPIKICGDIRSQYGDLLRVFDRGGYPPTTNYLFLGNYVDGGEQSIETVCLLLAYKIRYPENFFLLRGAHEIATVNRISGFYEECRSEFRRGRRLWGVFNDCFNCLPVAAVVDEKIFCVHAGLSPYLMDHDLTQIENITRPTATDVPPTGLLYDLLWSDPSDDVQGWAMNITYWGCSYIFGQDIVSQFLQRHNLDLICRAHQVVEDGYEFLGDNRKLVTVYSAPNYCGEGNVSDGAIMSVDENLLFSFKVMTHQEVIASSPLSSSPGESPPGELVIASPPLSSSPGESPPGELVIASSPHGESPPGELVIDSSAPGELVIASSPLSSSPGESPPGELVIASSPQGESPLGELVLDSSPPGELVIASSPLSSSPGESPPGSSPHGESPPGELVIASSPPRELVIASSGGYGSTSRRRSEDTRTMPSFKTFTPEEIEDATNNFCESRFIGGGGYGKVYKCKLDNWDVAVKILDDQGNQGNEGLKEYIKEMEVLERMRHENLIHLMGTCFRFRALVYEYLSNGSLEKCLTDRPSELTWQIRTRIVYQICTALRFLHGNRPEPLVHGDLKPHNVLLDANFNVKLADFGLCRFLNQGENSRAFRQTVHVSGSPGYMDLDFLGSGRVTSGVDVYSLGKTVVRILTGQHPPDIFLEVRVANIRGSYMTVVDPTVSDWPENVVRILAHFALRSTKPDRNRPEFMEKFYSDLGMILDAIND